MATAGVKGLENMTSSVGHFNASYPMALFRIRYPQSDSYSYRPGGRDDVITLNDYTDGVHDNTSVSASPTHSFDETGTSRVRRCWSLEALDNTAHSTSPRRHTSASTILFVAKKYS